MKIGLEHLQIESGNFNPHGWIERGWGNVMLIFETDADPTLSTA
jgi:hypothetical protein